MVARTPASKEKRRAAAAVAVSPSVVRETVKKVEKCVARLQELQYTVTGGNKMVAGASLSPRSTRGYLRTSLRCKQETQRMKNAAARGSSAGRLPEKTGEWRRMSLPAMLLGETISEVLQASRFAKDVVVVAAKPSTRRVATATAVAVSTDPRTPVAGRRKSAGEITELRARRTREKQSLVGSSSRSPPVRRARARISFKPASPPNWREGTGRRPVAVAAQRVSPKSRPWAKKAVLFPNPVFSSPSSHHHRFSKTGSPVIAARLRQGPPHKFLIKSPPTAARLQVRVKSSQPASLSPLRLPSSSRPKMAVVARLRRSFSPSRLASRLVAMSPLRSGASKREATPIGARRGRGRSAA
ncbi:unnamed protein product [Spirodela intermedia]|uniref:Uncharacterized protein n=1 Tax=Spirodela intermedia TaxID=51605 RepID=A0A7I8L7S4_SPIIN|nr:unnamed protein product [Spirodela intermedia]